MERLALRLRLHKVAKNPSSVILLHESMPGSKLVQGYCTVMGETCWHLWVEKTDGAILDMTRHLAELGDPEFKKCEFVLGVGLLPDKCMKEPDVVDAYELYKKDPKAFWKEQSKTLREFRSKFLRESKNFLP
jgi:hypothetical protein